MYCANTDVPGVKHARHAALKDRMLGIFVFSVTSALLALGFFRWLKVDRDLLTDSRKMVFAIALVLGLASVCLFLAFWIYTVQIGGSNGDFDIDFAPPLRWTRPGFWLSVVATVLACFGKGRSRIFVGIASAMLITIWFLLGLGL